MGGVGGPRDFSVSPSPFGLDFGTLDSDFELGLEKYCHDCQALGYLYLIVNTSEL